MDSKRDEKKERKSRNRAESSLCSIVLFASEWVNDCIIKSVPFFFFVAGALLYTVDVLNKTIFNVVLSFIHSILYWLVLIV